MQNSPILITSILKNNTMVLGGEIINHVYFLFLFFSVFQWACVTFWTTETNKCSFQCNERTEQKTYKCFDLNRN